MNKVFRKLTYLCLGLILASMLFSCEKSAASNVDRINKLIRENKHVDGELNLEDNLEWDFIIFSEPYIVLNSDVVSLMSEESLNQIRYNLLSIERCQLYILKDKNILSYGFLPTFVSIPNGIIVVDKHHPKVSLKNDELHP